MTTTVWDVVAYILNGLIFILIGLQLRQIKEGLEDYSAGSLVLWGLAISAVVIVVRFIWVIPAAMLPRILSKRVREKEAFEPSNLAVFGWAGMRVVSMAAALALPLTLADGSAFPHRNLIIYLTFCVILATLIGLGLTLPLLIKVLKIKPYSIYAEEYEVRNIVVSQTIAHIEENYALLQDELLNNIKSKYEVKFNRLQRTDLPSNFFGNGETLSVSIFNEYTQLQIDLINVERKKVEEMHRKGLANEEILRKIERELDLEETRLNMDMYEG
jgi:CPA1 family monovalent cation:H+ antiporter